MKYRMINNCPMCSAFMIGGQCVNCGYKKPTNQH